MTVPRTDSRQIAELTARSLFADMREAGFSDEMIIYVTAQVISELTASIRQRDDHVRGEDLGEVRKSQGEGTAGQRSVEASAVVSMHSRVSGSRHAG